jgi:hypothetical protein
LKKYPENIDWEMLIHNMSEDINWKMYFKLIEREDELSPDELSVHILNKNKKKEKKVYMHIDGGECKCDFCNMENDNWW